MECQQISAALEEREGLSTVTEYLRTLQLTPQPVHPGMGCPDMPGLWEDTHPENLQDEDLDSVAQELVKENVEVRYIRGFVQGRDEVQGASVEDLRRNRNMPPPFSVVKPQEAPPGEGSMERQKFS